MSILTIIFAAAFLLTLGLLIRSLFRQAGIQDAIKETSDMAKSQLNLWEEFGQHLDEGVALVNEQETIVYANSAFAELTEWPNRSAFQQALDTVVHLQDDQAKSIAIPTIDTVDTIFVIGKDGSRTSIRAIKRPLHRPEGYSVVILHDATAENAEKQLRHRLVNLSSFELRAPITAIKGYASMLLEGDAGKLPKQVTDYVQPILESTDKVLTIIDDMASVEALSTQRGKTKKTKTKVKKFITEAAPELSKVAKAAGRKLLINDNDLETAIDIDSTQISRLLVMLVNTASRTAKSGTEVNLSVQETARTIDFQITNQGSPLPKQSQANVFDYAGGHGLDEGIGFYVAQQIIEAHHAYVTVNTHTEGNMFVLSIPKAEPPKPAPAARQEAKPAAGKTE